MSLSVSIVISMCVPRGLRLNWGAVYGRLTPRSTRAADMGKGQLCVCAQCGKTYILKRSRGKRAIKYCNRSCAALALVPVIKGAAKAGVIRDESHHMAKTEHNVCAKFYCVRDPNNREHKFRNAAHFVRTHPELFPPGYADEPLAFPGSARVTTKKSKAALGIASLFLKGKRQAQSYLGWVGVWKKDRLGAIQWQRQALS